MLIRLIYWGRAVDAQTGALTDSILQGARAWNTQHGITGVRCLGQGVFLRVLEGERGALKPFLAARRPQRSTCDCHAAMHRLLLLLLLTAMPIFSHAVEEPDYRVIQTLGGIELRQYAPYVVAEVVLDATAEDAGSQAFPILAGYIFGKNKGEKKFAMTAPVTQSAGPVRMDMTAPVTQSAVAGGTRVQFVLPKGVTLDSAPEPDDPRVQLRLVPAARWAVIRYSGTWSQANYREHLEALQTALAAAGVATQGEPVWARYNGPLTPWFMRRNEIWLALR